MKIINLTLILLVMAVHSKGFSQEDHLQITLMKTLLNTKPDGEGKNARLWSIKKTDILRINLVEMTGEIGLHKHPDATHSLLIMEGVLKVRVATTDTILNVGDFISIPAGEPHKYWPVSERVLVISMDAPYYDPKKTIYLE